MFIKTFFKAFIAFCFIGLNSLFVEGMHPPRGRMRTGGSQAPVNLNTIDYNRIFEVDYLDDMQDALEERGGEVLNEVGLPADDPTIANFQRKIAGVLNHFTRILNNYERGLQHNYSQLPRRPNYQREMFINKRIEDYRKIVGDFDQFIEDSGLDVDDFDEGRNLDVIPSSLWDIGEEPEFTQLEDLLVRILQKERNLYLYYKLIVLARRLILSFIQDNYANAYITLFNDLPSQEDEDNNSYSSSGITTEEFGAFEDVLIPDRPNNTYNLYHLYYSEYVQGRPYLQVKLQLHYITQQLIAQMHPQAIVYNHQLMETEEIREDVAIQPQIRELHIQYPPPGRRRPRNGGRGGNGSGGNGQHGGGRRRRGDGGN
uniref:Secreted protein n=1 Tax=Meloidogyne javanica TaxID=6303 RepID=A0A915MWH4_MELJA